MKKKNKKIKNKIKTKNIKIYAETHRLLKVFAAKKGMRLADAFHQLLEELNLNER